MRRVLPLFAITGTMLIVLASAPAAADLYRWVDARGVVNYSNVPPQGVKAKQIAETQPTVSVIPPPEKPPEVQQAQREAALLRRIEQLEEELAALRRAPVTTVVYINPAPATAPEVTYSAPVVFPFPVVPWRGVKPGWVHRIAPRPPGKGTNQRPGGRPPIATPFAARPGLNVRAQF